ncbi:glycosyltransferase [Sporosarcina siberiensis]|uniref:Glycosyltransferase n=1 Tax=Sporosarcina siberiensis TaxID=1365606 RepID=A0ABW4SES9_9BACL
MNILVINVPANSGGALSVLNDFYNQVLNYEDKTVNWIFVISTPQLKENNNIKVLNFPWVKKSWGHRFYFDSMIAPILVKKYNVDKVFSLQNVNIPRISCEQILYVHQSLPFVDYKFNFKENKLLWMYQNVIGKRIISSIKKADKVIVQTEWMKNACIEKAQVKENKFQVISPEFNLYPKSFYKNIGESRNTFFYPANEMEYKNHLIIIKACIELKRHSVLDYKVLLTLNGNENEHISNLKKQVLKEQLPIHFIGSMTREEVFEMYTKSILLFPSYVETFGLPLLEAKLHNGVIFASDCPFSQEILKGYKNAYFFNPFNGEQLGDLMKEMLNNNMEYRLITDYGFKEEVGETASIIDVVLT